MWTTVRIPPYVESLRAAGREVVEIVSEPGLEGSRGGAERTLDAMVVVRR